MSIKFVDSEVDQYIQGDIIGVGCCNHYQAMGEVGTSTDKIRELLDRSYRFLDEGLFDESRKCLEEALGLDFDSGEVLSALKCTNFWGSRAEKLRELDDPYDKGEYLLREWRVFHSFSREFLGECGSCELVIRRWVFKSALDSYRAIQRGGEEVDREILFRIGRCYKSYGDYEKAVSILELANNRKRMDPEILAELADTYALINEMHASKLFFREALFIDPQRIELVFIESEMIRRLVRSLERMDFEGKILKEWMPVYGLLFGVLNVKRELKPLEYGRLRQSVFELENRVHNESPKVDGAVVPRLLNRYFWLIDHYMVNKEPRAKIEEVLEKIKLLDSAVYERYVL